MTDRPNVLVPIQILEGESIPEGIPELLANAHVVLLGYHVIPDQTAPGQARMQFEERAAPRLDQFEEILEKAGATVDTRLVFTHKAQTTIDRMIYEHDCVAAIVPKATRPPEEVLVAVRGTVGVDRIARVVAGLFGDTDVSVTLYHLAAEDATDEDVQTLLDGVADRLVELGMDEDALDTRVGRGKNPKQAIADAADEFDAIVMGESDPSIATFVFGMRAKQVAERFLGPVIVVQRERPQTEAETETETETDGNPNEDD
ncbi:universal stress protein UspA [Halalkaliarchaeum desulfuricum]|uniref:Universal stress protein UspA n=1 Tax=Halalkaliarchaeum desulfuricum TaxID=2055893 RepID=A0A343TMJ9_9EURY|nr:universal stress protein [Halalkaliarchaeum desulfuricum]AUX10321.1 universal stress protein UspA [Halalkaliarchaeum desulfuricum]